MPGFTPPGMIQTAAHAQSVGRRAAGGKRRARRAAPKVRKKKARGKPRPGTKAWMAYIRGKRGKRKK